MTYGKGVFHAALVLFAPQQVAAHQAPAAEAGQQQRPEQQVAAQQARAPQAGQQQRPAQQVASQQPRAPEAGELPAKRLALTPKRLPKPKPMPREAGHSGSIL